MIAIIADDFSGAAELAGIGFAHGLTAEVHTEFDADSRADLVVIDTDSRCCPAAEAARRVADAVRAVRRAGSSLFFKKIDSVIRGPVLAELRSALSATEKQKALLVPANPSRGRTIRDGQYFVEGLPLEHTAFGADPIHPRRSSDILEMLDTRDCADIFVLRPGQEIPAKGIAVGEAETMEDMAIWARTMDETVLPAGSADFFAAQLAIRGLRPLPYVTRQLQITSPCVRLLVCGSAEAYDAWREQQSTRCDIPFVPMPPELWQIERSQESIARWACDVVVALDRYLVAGVAIGHCVLPKKGISHALTEHLVELVAQVLALRRVPLVLVEGGGTASALFRRMEWKRTAICHQYAPGVVAMAINAGSPDLLAIKPGSYDWPDAVWQA